jgi:type IV pilus assembly protein PilE
VLTDAKKKGFHLLEILIVLTIIAISGGWVLGNYQSFLVFERRSEAKTALLKLAASLEDYALIHGSYTDATLLACNITSLVADNFYLLQIDIADTFHYHLSAIPRSTQAKLDTQCGALSLSSNGEKNISGTKTWQHCW